MAPPRRVGDGRHQTLNEFDGNDIRTTPEIRDKEQTLQIQTGVRREKRQNHMQQDSWTPDTKHETRGSWEEAINLLSDTQLHARLSKHSSIG